MIAVAIPTVFFHFYVTYVTDQIKKIEKVDKLLKKCLDDVDSPPVVRAYTSPILVFVDACVKHSYYFGPTSNAIFFSKHFILV